VCVWKGGGRGGQDGWGRKKEQLITHFWKKRRRESRRASKVKLKSPTNTQYTQEFKRTFSHSTAEEEVHALHGLPVLLGRRAHQPDVRHLALSTTVRTPGEVHAHGLGDVVGSLQLLHEVDGPCLGLDEPDAAELRAGAGY